MMPSALTLTALQARHILSLAGREGPVIVTQVARGNDVWRLRQGKDAYFLKTHTKDWYGSDPSHLPFCVQHESVAYEILAAHGLPVPDVVLARSDFDNPLGQPFLLTHALPGTSLMPLLRQHEGEEFAALLHSAGTYLRRVHEIMFRFPGYLMSHDGPDAPPDENAWQHPIWTAKSAQEHALALLEADRPRISPVVARDVEAAFSSLAAQLAPLYQSPRFTHGDCHAQQFFLAAPRAAPRVPGAHDWSVSGFVDMEVASAGAVEHDLIKMSLELMSHFPPETRWWEPLFAGYGRGPDFELFRLLLLSSSEESFRAYGAEHWPATREETLAGLLAANDWRTLFSKPR
jgi:aminoglycoside phosphotransferase